MAYNLCKNQYRHLAYEQDYLAQLDADPTTESQVEVQIDRRQLEEALQQVLASLSPPLRMLFSLKVGMQKTYTTKSEVANAGSAAADVSGEATYKVAGKTTDGYQINMKSKADKIDANQIMQNITTADIMQLINSKEVEMLTDKNGALTGIKNAKELLENCNAVVDSTFNAIISQSAKIKDNEMLKSAMQKATKTMKEMFTEDYLLESFVQTPGITSLNGKAITDGMVEDGMFTQILKTKTTYSILNGGKTIVLDTKADVDMKTMKDYVLKMMDSLIPESVAKQTNPEQLSSMIDNMISNGTVKMDMNRKVTYDIGDDGWVKKLVMEMDFNSPAQTTKMRQVITQKD